ncbi:MAG: hypothetical protein JO225_03230 [Candidatus Eremiobacteraeota bacterium]|nr:hypothetical protein [Candidatus Eremiobacteraeota bacterium]MBV8642908.1 hypothetical protein [Candidatus Eremiobacteraeota bacterium]
MATHRTAASTAPITYTPAGPINGPTFTCPRCERVYPYPPDHGKPVRCECGWWYTNLGHGRIIEEFRPRIGGAATSGPEAAAGPASETH